MTVILAAAMLAVVVAPHLLDLRVAPPATAIALWLSSVIMRALLVLVGVFLLLFEVPSTELFAAIAHWCWHSVVPILATHLGIGGHQIADAAVVLPAVILAMSVLSVAFGVVRAARAVRALVKRAGLAPGPRDSVIVGGADVVVATAGLRRPRVLVSAGALARLDDEELAASLDHERGHIARGHRWLLLAAELARGVGHFVPGTRHAIAELRLHAERDADQWALRQHHDPLALASAICKAAIDRTLPSVAFASLGGSGGIDRRLDELTAVEPPSAGLRCGVLRLVAVGMVAVTVAVIALVPVATAAALGAADTSANPPAERHCVA